MQRHVVAGSRLAAICAAALMLAACASAGTNAADRAPVTSSSARPVAIARTPVTTPTPTPVTPKPNACAKNTATQLVKVDLRAQQLWLCHRHRVAYSSPITSGIVGQYTSTPTGRYTIQALDRHQTLTLLDGSQYTVDYWIPFDAPLYGFHDSPWQHFPYGSAKYKTHGSHGCVHMPHDAIAHLYRWAHVGTEVSINA